MALKCFVLDNHPDQAVRHEAVQNAVRAYLKSDAVSVEYSEKGAPSIVGSSTPKYLSVTTTGDKMVAALYDKPVGIDGEFLPKYETSRTDFAILADRFFAPEESEYVHDGPTVADEKDRFLKIWTRKEAYVKCAGKTLAEFPNFSVVEGDKMLARVGGIPLRKFAIAFEGSEHYLFAIAGIS